VAQKFLAPLAHHQKNLRQNLNRIQSHVEVFQLFVQSVPSEVGLLQFVLAQTLRRMQLYRLHPVGSLELHMHQLERWKVEGNELGKRED